MDDEADTSGIPSKSQRKRDMDALQETGAALVALGEKQLAAIELPEDLREAVTAARAISAFGARRRQLQYIGKLMRRVDPAPIRAQLEVWRSATAESTAQLHHIERWRERLLAEPLSVSEFIAEFPGTDTQQLRTLIRNTLDERARGKPPKHFRALFQMIRVLLEAHGRHNETPPQA